MELAEMRRAAGFKTQQELADLTGISRGQISKWEIGMFYPKAPLLVVLAQALHTTEGEIIAAITKTKELRKGA